MKDKPKIAVIGSRGPCTAGGIATITQELYPRLTPDFDIVVYTRSPYFSPADKIQEGMVLIHLPTLHQKGLEAFVHTFLATLHACFSNADILHYHAQGPALFMPLVRFLSPQKKIVFSCHGIDWQRAKWTGLGKKLIYWGEQLSARFADTLIGCAPALVDYYKATYQKDMVFIPNGTQLPPPASAEVSETLHLSPQGYFLFLGRIVPEKAVHEIILAYQQLPESLQNQYPLVIAGKGVGTDD